MSIDKLIPHAGRHAIESAILAIEWGVELTVAQLEGLRAAVKTTLKDFPREEPQQTFRVSLSPMPGVSPVPTPEIGGYIYTKYSVDGCLRKQVQLTRANCLFVVADYSSWRDFVDEAGNVFSKAVAALPTGNFIANIGLQYSDSFKSTESLGDLDLSQVFRPDSPFIASHMAECRLACHSHHGYLEDSLEPVANRRLDNINVNIVDEPDGWKIQILSSHRATLDAQFQVCVVKNHVRQIQEYLHEVHKGIIRRMLCDDLLAKIGFQLEE